MASSSTAPGTANNAIIDIYKPLPPIKNQRLKFSSTDPFTPTYVKSNLSLNSDPVAIYEQRVKNRQMLLENPARESRAKKERLEKKTRKKADKQRIARALGKKTAKLKGVWQLEDSQAKWELFLPLHHLWLGYMSELLGLSDPGTPQAKAIPNSSSMHPKLLKADFHGSIMTVKESKNPALVGLSGIVFHESENAFKVVTKQDKVKCKPHSQQLKVKLIPKQNSIFTFAVPLYSTLASSTSTERVSTDTVLEKPHIAFDLYGNQFRFRAADRAGRKFKSKETIEL